MITPILIVVALLGAAAPPASPSPQGQPAAAAPADPAAAARLVREGEDLQKKGSLGEALLKYEEAIKLGAEGGDLFYQTGHLLKTVRQDAEGARRYMTRAVPLLEKAAAEPGLKSPAPFYYLATALGVELGDAARAIPPAKKGADLAGQGAFKDLKDGVSLYQVGRLYSLSGQPDRALPWYEKAVAALDTGRVTDRETLVASIEQLSGAYMTRGDYDKGITWFQRLMALEPRREQERLETGMTLIKGGRHKEAMQILRGFANDELASEANYIVRILTRYLALGAPTLAAEQSKLDDTALLEETRKAAQTLAGIRQKEEAAGKSEPQPEIPFEWRTGKKGMKLKVPIRPTPPPGWKPKDPNNPTPEEQDILDGAWIAPRKETPPPSAERTAAEKVFFALLVEDLRRGHYQRERGVIQGFSALIFR